ncbi:MAG: pectin esterase [Prevotella sp.]|nr:pectin esterase [Candidatus Prevotella equi]
MRKLLFLILAVLGVTTANAGSNENIWDNADTIVVSRDGTGHFRNLNEAIDVCRAFMDYHKVIYVKKGTYKEKVVIPSFLTNVEICGEDRDETIITFDDHANIKDMRLPNNHKLGTFATYTLKIEGNDITLKNITIENNAPKLGQAVALHTEGDRLTFINCRFLGNQDTIYTGVENTRLYFNGCYIEGTTDFIFGPSIVWFEACTIKNKSNSYITAASTPKGQKYGYILNNCKIIADEGVDKCYLGRPWREYAYTVFMNCELGKHITPVGWNDWKKDHEKIRYMEYNNRGEGADVSKRADWSRQLTKKEAQKITLQEVFSTASTWMPEK